ncbi:hypothetical protein JCM16303_005846 [Sporobolomyces ruberrimus]
MNSLRTPPHSSPELSSDESSFPPPSRHTNKSRSRNLYSQCSTSSSPEAGRPEWKRPRSSTILTSTSTTAASLPVSELAPPARLPTPALTPEELLPQAAQSNFPSTELSIEQSATEREEQHAQLTASLQAEKDRFVNGLVGASVLAIESIWGPSAPTSTTRFTTSSSVLPIHYFVREVLRRSRTSCSTLQLALYYLHKSRKEIRDAVAQAQESREEIQRLARGERERIQHEEVKKVEGFMEKCYFEEVEEEEEKEEGSKSVYPSPPESPDTPHLTSDQSIEEEKGESLTDRLTRLLEVQKSPLLCGRRMFLASLISASKYLQDRNYSNRAWAKISGLEIKEINSNERAFLELVEWELHLKADDFKRWTDRLNTLTAANPIPSVPCGNTRQGLARSSSEYVPPPPTLQACPVSSSSTRRPTSSNLIRSKLALTRGNSAPQLESSKPPRSSSGFPIAQPISRLPIAQPQAPRVVPAPRVPEVELETTEEEDNVVQVATVPPARKVRGLPLRRSKVASTGIPSTWGAGSHAGEYVVGRTGELVPVH